VVWSDPYIYTYLVMLPDSRTIDTQANCLLEQATRTKRDVLVYSQMRLGSLSI
jgi:hypothetical protein